MDWAGWDDWLLDVFNGVYKLNSSVRRKIANDCALMLKRLAELD
jgi:hypothetical protein